MADTTPLLVELPTDLRRRVDAGARAAGQTLKAYVVTLLERELAPGERADELLRRLVAEYKAIGADDPEGAARDRLRADGIEVPAAAAPTARDSYVARQRAAGTAKRGAQKRGDEEADTRSARERYVEMQCSGGTPRRPR